MSQPHQTVKRIFALALLLLLFPLVPIDTLAQTKTVFVSNLAQVTSAKLDEIIERRAILFTTGSNALGYWLDDIIIYFESYHGDVYRSQTDVHTVYRHEGIIKPHERIGRLDVQRTTGTTGQIRFIPEDPVSLSANRTYAIVYWELPSEDPNSYEEDSVLYLDSTGNQTGLSGFSIADSHLSRDYDEFNIPWTDGVSAESDAFLLSVNGRVKVPFTNTPVIPTDRPTATPTNTALPTDTPTATPTARPTGTLPPTNTPTATPTGTLPPTNTPTPTHTQSSPEIDPDPPKPDVGSRKNNSPPPSPLATRAPAFAYTCENLPASSGIRVSATLGLRSGVQCQLIDAGGIGNRAVIQSGFTHAIDVWSYVEQGVEVCFPGNGTITFLDAATAPRSIAAVRTYGKGGDLCAWLERPGSLVFLQSSEPMTTPLTDCKVKTNYILNLRAKPGGEVLDHVAYNTRLTATGKLPGWYKVRFEGLEGWLSAKYVTTAGSC